MRKQGKRAANRAVRRSQEVADGKAYRKEYNSWDIRDFSIHAPEIKKAYRK